MPALWDIPWHGQPGKRAGKKESKEARPKWAGFKRMADYGAGPVLHDHRKNREIKTAGRRLIKNRKLPVWMGVSESAP